MRLEKEVQTEQARSGHALKQLSVAKYLDQVLCSKS